MTFPVCFLPLESSIKSLLPPAGLGLSPTLPLLDLSYATRLKDIEFQLCAQSVQWIASTLETAKSEHLRLTIFVPSYFTDSAQPTVNQEWEDLDYMLVQLQISRSISPRLKCRKMPKSNNPETWMRALLPELMNRGTIDVVEVD